MTPTVTTTEGEAFVFEKGGGALSIDGVILSTGPQGMTVRLDEILLDDVAACTTGTYLFPPE